MGFPSQLSAGQITQVRQTAQSFRQYLLLCPNDIIWQTQPNEDISNEVYADFLWTGTLQGDRADVLEGMTVLITTSDSDLSTVIYRGRVRLVPDGTTFYINETSATLSTAYYVTVLNDWDIHEKLERRTADGTAYKDWDLTFQQLPPVITGLQSTYVDTSGTATVTFDFTVSADPTADGATISTYSWDVDDGTINSGTGTATINVTFPGAVTNEHRWVILTITDSNGVSNYFTFEVYTVDLTDTSTTVIALDTDQAAITGSVDEGFNLSVRAWDGFTSILDRTRCALLSVDNYGGTTTPITQNVAFVGRLRQEGNFTAGDPQRGTLKETRLTIEGFVSQLGRLHGAGLYLKTDATPTAWGEVDTLTIKRALVYMLAWHSTYLNVASVTFDADSDDYIWPEYTVQEASLLEWLNSVADDQNAQLVIAGDGQTTFQRDARIAGVSGLTTVYDFVTGDMLNFTLEDEYIDTYSQAVIGAATYNTTASKSTTYVGRAPAQAFGPGWESGQVNQQIMKANLTDAQARTEAGSRVANYLATLNPRPRLTVELMPGFYWLVPSVHQLYTFTIAAADNTRGRAYTTADKWLCTDISYDYNPQRGYYTWNGTFELIVAGGAAGIQVTLVPDVNDLRLPTLPGISASLTDYLDPLVNYPLDDPDFELPGIDTGITQPKPWKPQPQPGCEILNVSMKTGSIVTTSNVTVFGQPYAVTVEGQGKVAAALVPWSESFDFTTSNEGFSVGALEQFPVHAGQGTYSAGVGWQTTYFAGANGRVRGLIIEKSFAAFSGVSTLTAVTMTYNFTNSGNWDGTGNTHRIYAYVPTVVNMGEKSAPGDSTANGKSFGITPTQALTSGGRISISFISGRNFAPAGDPGGQATVTAMVASGLGINPYTGSAESTAEYGDAFYYNYDIGTGTLYDGSYGFQVDSARPSGIPTYQSSHSYTFITTGTGSPLGFRFLDSDYSDNENAQLTVTICGQGMTQG